MAVQQAINADIRGDVLKLDQSSGSLQVKKGFAGQGWRAPGKLPCYMTGQISHTIHKY
jgi:hypothetical protein